VQSFRSEAQVHELFSDFPEHRQRETLRPIDFAPHNDFPLAMNDPDSPQPVHRQSRRDMRPTNPGRDWNS
jgi:hypothetical protein